MIQVRTRFAPSPTGFLHVGGAYMSLFNYAFAKKNKGKFILRIEDTDIKRHVPGAEEAIFNGLKWLGLFYDEGPDVGGKFGPYRQSERLHLYKKYGQELLEKKLAYREDGAIRFKASKGKISWQDLVRGKIVFANKLIKDFIILKSDGYPTYNFAVVVDDWLMKISHVIRAEEHISNTPRQLMLYQAFGVKPPEFAHLPLLRNPDRSKISKRKNPVALSWYQEQGYFPEALVNFLCLLGWSHPQEKDIFSIKEFIRLFSFDRVSTSAPIFDFNKLNWLNGVYIRQKTEKELLPLIEPFVPKAMPADAVGQTIPLVKDRLVKLSDFSSLVDFFIKEPKIDPKLLIQKGKTKKETKEVLEGIKYQVLSIKARDWQAGKLEKIIRRFSNSLVDWSTSQLFMTIRVAITGKTATPPLFESIELLGKKKTLFRLKSVLKFFLKIWEV